MRFLSFLKSDASSAEETLMQLNQFNAILDAIVKIVTTIALLAGLEAFRQYHASDIITVMYWVLWFFFFCYLQRLYIHCVTYLLENRTSLNMASERAKWSIGLSGFVFSMFLLIWGDAALNDLIRAGFLQSEACTQTGNLS